MMDKTKGNNFLEILKNYGLYIAITIITIGLLIFFKYNQKDVENLLKNSKDNLLAFYTQNLKPLATRTNLTNEDVFNFALHNNLPLDKNEQKVLQLGMNEESGNNTFEIKPVAINPDTKNYEKFIQYLRLNGQQIKELDSVLNNYKKEIYTSVLLNDHNTVAVNPKISIVRDAVVTDLIDFAKKINYTRVKKDIPEYVNLEEKKIKSSIKNVLNAEMKDFIVFTPDTVVQLPCVVDDLHLSERLTHLEDMDERDLAFEDINFEFKLTHEPLDYNEKIIFDINSKHLKAALPKSIYNIEQHHNEIDLLESQIAEITNKLNSLSFSLSSDESPIVKMMINTLEDSVDSYTFKFDMNIKAIDSMVEESMMIHEETWEEFGMKMDSLAIELESEWNDSLYWHQKEKIKKEVKRAKEEARKAKRRSN